MLQNLTYELSVLARAVEHKNLSAAAVHVGLSQPQLSRLIAKIEHEMGVVLLDRTARRKSGWTPLALDLVKIFSRGIGRLELEIMAIAQERELTELRIGTLEGVSSIALQFAQSGIGELKMKKVYLDILDFQDLESMFLSGNLDLIFTVRPPSKQKFEHLLEVGYQQEEKMSSDKSTYVCSQSELVSNKKLENDFPHMFVSNSLSLRRRWLTDFGGTGSLPTDTRRGRGKGIFSVYLIGSDLISPKLWAQIAETFDV
jgi:DNA-binding transcriptional LysR family regulator